MSNNRPIHQIVDHEDLPGVLQGMGIRFEEDLREALQHNSLCGRIAESDIARLREIISPRNWD